MEAFRTNREKSSKWSGENNVEKSEKRGGGDSEREGTVEINSLKKRAKKHCYHGMLWKRDLEARQYDFLLSSKSTQGE